MKPSLLLVALVLSGCSKSEPPPSPPAAQIEVAATCPKSATTKALPPIVSVLELRAAYDKLDLAQKETARARDVCAERLAHAVQVLHELSPKGN